MESCHFQSLNLNHILADLQNLAIRSWSRAQEKNFGAFMRYLVIGNFRREDKSKWRMKWNNLTVNHNPLMQHLMLTVSVQDAELPTFGMMISLLKTHFSVCQRNLWLSYKCISCRSCRDWVWHFCSRNMHRGTMLAGTSIFPSKKMYTKIQKIARACGFSFLFMLVKKESTAQKE